MLTSRCAENIEIEIPNERTRVGYLIDNIEVADADVKAAIASIKLDDGPGGLRTNFERAVALLVPVDPSNNRRVLGPILVWKFVTTRKKSTINYRRRSKMSSVNSARSASQILPTAAATTILPLLWLTPLTGIQLLSSGSKFLPFDLLSTTYFALDI
jgi:hypothetical protein